MSEIMTRIPNDAPREIRGSYGPHGERGGQKEIPALALSEWAFINDISAPRWEFVRMLALLTGNRDTTERAARKSYPTMILAGN